jgi:hypothetical protein
MTQIKVKSRVSRIRAGGVRADNDSCIRQRATRGDIDVHFRPA